MMGSQVMAILLITTGGLVAGLSLPLILRWVPPNHWYGVRLKASFQSEAMWYRINRRGGLYLLMWSLLVVLIGVAIGLMPPQNSAWIIILACFSPLVMLIGAFQTWHFAGVEAAKNPEFAHDRGK